MAQEIDIPLPANPRIQREGKQIAVEGRIPRLHLAALSCGVICAALGFAVIIGWFLNSELLMTVVPGHISMKANTAADFFAAGIALLFSLGRSVSAHRTARLMALVATLFGALTLVEYLAGVNLHIDEIFVPDPVQRIFPGRMAWITSTNFCLAGTSLLCLNAGTRMRRLGLVLGLVLVVDSFTAIVASVYGVKIFYGAIGYNSMAFHTGVGFVTLGMGTLLAQPDSMLIRVLSADQAGGKLARRFLPLALLLPVVLGSAYLRPGLNFGQDRFGMALMAVTLAATGAAALWAFAAFLNRAERQQAELLRFREESAEAVRQSESELRLVTDHLPTLLSYIDADGRFLRINRTYEEWLGLPSDAIVGKTIREVLGETYWVRNSFALEAAVRGESITFETSYPTKSGNRIVEITYAPNIDEAGRVRGLACMVLDLEERRKAQQALRDSEKLESANRVLYELANTDLLTGMNNRRAFEERLVAEFATSKARERELSLILIDIDDFKLRNDTWGHAAGDQVLRELGSLLSGAVRGPDIAARFGGEEFAILLPGNSRPQAAVVANRIARLVAEREWSEGAVTLSMGISTRSADMAQEQSLVDAADAALYEAKRTGKNRICFQRP